jgi:hypothetical protein
LFCFIFLLPLSLSLSPLAKKIYAYVCCIQKGLDMEYICKERGVDVGLFVHTLAKNLCYLNALFEKIPNAELTQWMTKFFAGLDVCIVHIFNESMDCVREELEQWLDGSICDEQVKQGISGRCLHEIITCLFALRPIPFLPNKYIVVPGEDTFVSWIINALQPICEKLTPIADAIDLVADLFCNNIQ